MSGNIFVDFVFLFLICYAIFSIFYSLSEFLLRRYCKYPAKHFFVLLLKHKSETLECDIRCAVAKSLKEKCALLIVCEDLDFEEYKLLWRIADVYDHIILTTPDKVTDNFDNVALINGSL